MKGKYLLSLFIIYINLYNKYLKQFIDFDWESFKSVEVW